MRTIKLAAALVSVIAASPCFSQAPAEKNAVEANQDWQAAGVIDDYKTHIYSLAFGPGLILVAGDAEGVRVWDVGTKQEHPFSKRPLENASAITGITYAPDNSWVNFRGLHEYHLAYNDDHLKDGRPISYGSGFLGIAVWPLAIASDGKTYAKRRAQTNAVDIARVDYFVRPVRRANQAFCRGHIDEPACAAFSPDGQFLATGSRDKTVRLWNASSGKELAVLTGHTDAIVAVEYSPDGKLIATGGKDGVIKLWDAATNKERASIEGKSAVRCLAFVPDGKSIATGYDDGLLRILNLEELQQETILTDHTGSVFAVAFSRDGKLLASGGQDKVLRLWKK